MDKAKIQTILQARYNQANWKQFLAEAFSNAQLFSTPEPLVGINTDAASQALKLGYIKLNEDGIERTIAVFEVTLAQGIVLERNRVGLRNLLRKFWKDIDGAFIVYYRPENANWRFTYVSELTGFNGEGELIKVKTEPKRYTYVLGEGESCKTATERFSILSTKAHKASLDDVKEAFSVEKLSKSFFDEYKEHYQDFVQFFTGKRLVKKGSAWEEQTLTKAHPQLTYIFNGNEKDVRDFCKKLLGRIVFLYFIQKKGWLGVPIGSDWGQGDYHFLTNLFNHCRNPELFYQQYLSKLFFDTLNNKRDGDLIELIEGHFCRIPYLNGGLFEEDDPNHRNLIFDANLFKDLFKFFNQYNFTIYEDDPNDHTVAVDPEMLGHIFENLLEDNKDKGAFYTPKEIVHYMCQESLIEYLTTWFEGKDYQVQQDTFTSFDNTQQTSFISANEGRAGQGVLEIAQPADTTGKIINRSLIEKLLKKQLNDEDKKAVIEHVEEFNEALDRVKICDPAIGSGAFPMGLLHEIFIAKQTLYNFQHGATNGFDAATTKLNIIQNSIYGVDIEHGAVDIARLRFWLSLVVDEEQPKALPNLDFKIVVGNSLVSKLGDDVIEVDWDIRPVNHGLFGSEEAKNIQEILKQLTKLQKEFFDPSTRKKDLSIKIRNLKIDLLIEQLNLMINSKGLTSKPDGNNKITLAQTQRFIQTEGWKHHLVALKALKLQQDKPLEFFDWQLNFAEVLNNEVAERVGFDIVIANPPYLKERDNAHIFEAINNSRIGNKYHQGKMDYWYYFLHTALDISSSTACVSFITSRYWINSQGASKLISRLKNIASFASVVDIGKLKVFDNVAGHHMIATYSKRKLNTFKYKKIQNEIKAIECDFNNENTSIEILSNSSVFKGDEIIFDSQKVKVDYKNTLGQFYDLTQGVVEASDKISTKQLKKINKLGFNVGDGVFVLNNNERDKLNLNPDEETILKKYLDPNDVIKWGINNTKEKWLIYADSSNKNKIASNSNYKNLKHHLDKYTDFITSSNRPYGLHRPRDQRFFENKKIIFKGMFSKNEFSIDSNKYYVGMSFISIVEKVAGYSLEYLLGILNSRYAYHWFHTYGKKRGAGVDIGVDKLRAFPLPDNYSEKLERKVTEILLADKSSLPILEQQLNLLVYRLYNLSIDEVKEIEPDFNLSEERYLNINN